MVNEKLLDSVIKESGRTYSYLAGKMHISLNTFKHKRANRYPFNSDEIEILCREIPIKGLKKKDAIFFAKPASK